MSQLDEYRAQLDAIDRELAACEALGIYGENIC